MAGKQFDVLIEARCKHGDADIREVPAVIVKTIQRLITFVIATRIVAELAIPDDRSNGIMTNPYAGERNDGLQ
jgi:hypothetical protein